MNRMKPILLFLTMVFLHCFTDYHLQGILAKMKQKKWWKDQIKDLDYTRYNHDYLVALIVHSFEWSFIMMLPIMIKAYRIDSVLSILICITLFCINVYFHCRIDDAKANKHIISLWDDQCYHMIQIIVTWGIWEIAIGW